MKNSSIFRFVDSSIAAVTLALVAVCVSPMAVGAETAENSQSAGELKPRDYYGKVAEDFVAMLPRCHVTHRAVDDEISQRAWTNLVTFYDAAHMIFLKTDLDRLAVHEKTLDDELKRGDVSFAYELNKLYLERLTSTVNFATNLIAEGSFDFTTNESWQVKRKDAPWPADEAEAHELWRLRLKNELLVRILAKELDQEEADEKKAKRAAVGKSDEPEEKTEDAETLANDPDTPEESMIKYYRQLHAALTEPDEEQVLQALLSAVARAYDPHSDYLSPTSKDDFDMEMNLTLCGVGAVLGMEDGALKIDEIMPGGPMDRDGRIVEGDKIVGVRQGDGEMENILWKPMKKTIKKIRGPKGSRVTLEIVPKSDPSGATKKRIELVRDEIKLDDQAATGRVETVTLDGVTRKLGYVYLPSFYGTMDKREGDDGYRSCANDVRDLVCTFNGLDVEGLVLDLRSDGGGSLVEAEKLSGVFVDRGPVVQIWDGRAYMPMIEYIERRLSGNLAAFRKPMVVLIDRASASASEIVAGHLRDTGRAIVLGDRLTHGKGTVQTLMEVNRWHQEYGTAKITTARFYRIDGRSTQFKGVSSDIMLPSVMNDLEDLGENKLPYALPFSRIRRVDNIKPAWNLETYIPRLAEASAKRRAEDERYQKHLAVVNGNRDFWSRTVVPLERSERKAMMKADRKLNETETDADEEEEANPRGKKKKRSRIHRNQPLDDDIVLDEAFRVLSDLVKLVGGETMPRARMDWSEAIFGGF